MHVSNQEFSVWPLESSPCWADDSVHIPFLNLTLKCPVGGRCTVLGENLKKIWIFFSHVLHKLWGNHEDN